MIVYMLILFMSKMTRGVHILPLSQNSPHREKQCHWTHPGTSPTQNADVVRKTNNKKDGIFLFFVFLKISYYGLKMSREMPNFTKLSRQECHEQKRKNTPLSMMLGSKLDKCKDKILKGH